MAQEDPRSQADENGDETTEQNGGNGDSRISSSVRQELGNVIREAMMEVLGPAARQATSSAAKYAVSKGPEMVTKNVMPAVRERGGPGEILKQATGGEGGGGVVGMAGKALSKVTGGGGGGAATGWGHNRRMPVQQIVYCSVPVRYAFNGWTEYNEWAGYMHRANQVDEQIDEEKVRVKVTEKMWGFTRPFTAEVVAQKPDQFIRWESKDGTKHTGVINFHELGPRLTLIEVNLDHAPSGLVEKFARGTRFVKRAMRADFHRFQAWIEMKTEEELEELEGWRGTVENGEIVKSHEDAIAEERDRDDQEGEPEGEYEQEPEDETEEPEGEAEEEPEDEAEEEPEGEAEEEPEGEAEEEPEDEAEEEPEDEAEEESEPPRSRRRRSSSGQEEPERPRRRRRASTAQGSEEASPRRRRRSDSSDRSSGARSRGGRSSRSAR